MSWHKIKKLLSFDQKAEVVNEAAEQLGSFVKAQARRAKEASIMVLLEVRQARYEALPPEELRALCAARRLEEVPWHRRWKPRDLELEPGWNCDALDRGTLALLLALQDGPLVHSQQSQHYDALSYLWGEVVQRELPRLRRIFVDYTFGTKWVTDDDWYASKIPAPAQYEEVIDEVEGQFRGFVEAQKKRAKEERDLTMLKGYQTEYESLPDEDLRDLCAAHHLSEESWHQYLGEGLASRSDCGTLDRGTLIFLLALLGKQSLRLKLKKGGWGMTPLDHEVWIKTRMQVAHFQVLKKLWGRVKFWLPAIDNAIRREVVRWV